MKSKIKIFLLLLISLLNLVVYSCSKKENDLQQAGLKGKIKAIREITYQASQEGDTLIKGPIVMGEDIQNYYITYNSLGYTIDMYNYDNTNTLLNRWHYVYDNHNQTLSGLYYLADNILMDSTYYVYDKRGNIIEYYHYNGEGALQQKILEHHDRKGNVIEQKVIDQDNLLKQTTKLDYKGKNLIRSSSYNENNHLMFYSFYTYDKQDNLLSQTIYNADSSINTRGFYSYNAHNDIIKLKTLTPGNKEIIYCYQYVYDKIGNWTQKTTILNNEVILLTIRNIEYY